jgi:transposase
MGKGRRRGSVAVEAARDGESSRRGSGRWSAARKAEIVLRLLRGEEVDMVSREVHVNAGTLAKWREEFIAAGREGLKSRETTTVDRDLLEARAKIGELTMKNDILQIVMKKRGLDSPWTRS